MNLKTAFLNRSLEEEIYMDQHIGFLLKCQKRTKCVISKALFMVSSGLLERSILDSVKLFFWA